MDVELIPQQALIKGSASITYYNNSPDTLKKLNFKLIQNVHVPTTPRSVGVDSLYLTNGMQIEKYSSMINRCSGIIKK